MSYRNLAACVVVLAFSLAATLVFAAGDSWVVIKDKNGVCKIIEAKEKTPATIAGPFKTKEDAEKAKAKECPKEGDSPTEKIKEKVKEKIKDVIPPEKKK